MRTTLVLAVLKMVLVARKPENQGRPLSGILYVN